MKIRSDLSAFRDQLGRRRQDSLAQLGKMAELRGSGNEQLTIVQLHRRRISLLNQLVLLIDKLAATEGNIEEIEGPIQSNEEPTSPLGQYTHRKFRPEED